MTSPAAERRRTEVGSAGSPSPRPSVKPHPHLHVRRVPSGLQALTPTRVAWASRAVLAARLGQ
jgi:hypothetical protein